MIMHSRHVGECFRHHLFTGILIILLAGISGITGCSDSGGGGGHKAAYMLTGYDGVDSSAGNENLTFASEFPWFANMTFQAEDETEWGDPDLTVNDIQVMEDGTQVDKVKSEMNVRKRDSLPADYTYTLKTVLLLDNTPSEAANLDKIKEAAQIVIDSLDEKEQQQIAIVAFNAAGEPELVQDFTDNTTTLNSHVAIGSKESIQPSFGSTDFYGAVILALSLWENNHSPADKDFEQGFVVAITDGKDTTALYDVSDAIAKRGDKQVFTVPVGTDIPENILTDLQNLGNAGFYHVTDPYIEADEKVDKKENLCENLQIIQNRMLAWADAFYWVQYISPCIDNSSSQKTHAVELSVIDNSNAETNATVSGNFSSEDFFTGTADIYFNATASDPDGVKETIILVYPGETGVTASITAVTFSRDSNNPSEFEWQSANTAILTVKADEKDDSKCVVTAIAPGDTEIIVTDKTNSVTQRLVIKVKIKEPSYEFVRYAVQSAKPWFVDATFNIRETDPEDNQWIWVTDLLREDFQILENNEKVDLEKSEINIRKRVFNLPSDYTYTLKTVLFIDNSRSSSINLDLMKAAAKSFAKRALLNDPKDNSDPGPLLDVNGKFQQQIAIVTFTEEGDSTVWLEFTNDIDEIYASIDSVPDNSDITDFYGAMLDALNLWENDILPRDGNKELVQGVVVALTDGFDTFDGFHTPEQVLGEIGTRQVICVGVGDDIVSESSDILEEFGKAGYYASPDPGYLVKIWETSDDGKNEREVTYTSLQRTLMHIQEEIVDFANSFYWLSYTSYVVKSDEWVDDCERREDVKISIYNNANTANLAHYSGKFRSCEFFVGDDNRIYINAKPSNPWGIDTVDLEFLTITDTVIVDPKFALEAFTYNYSNTPAYEWVSTNQNIVRIDVDEASYADSRATLFLPAAKQVGSAYVNIEDTGNTSMMNLLVNVTGTSLYPLAYYPFSGSADDFSGNGYHGEVHGAVLTADRFGKIDSAYEFGAGGIAGGYIAIANLFYGSAPGAYASNIDKITVCAWVKNKSVYAFPGVYDTIISYRPGEYWSLSLTQGNCNWNTSTATLPNNAQLKSSERVNDGVWHHVCGTYDYSGTHTKKLYIDGVKVAEADITADGPIGTGNTLFGFIGAESAAYSFNGNRYSKGYFVGSIDDVMIFHQILPDRVIKILAEN